MTRRSTARLSRRRDKLIAGLWLAVIIGVPALVGGRSLPIELGLFLVIFLASGVVPAILLRLKAMGK